MKKYIFCLLLVSGILFLATTTHAASCTFSDGTIVLDNGRAINYAIKIDGGRDENDNIICPTGFGTQENQIDVYINDIPVSIISWGQQSISVSVPYSVEGLANIKVIGKNGNTNTYVSSNQLLVSLKIDSYPSQITLGEPIEITGNFVNTPGSDDINGAYWPGKVSNLTTDGPNTRLPLVSWVKNKIIISTSEFDRYRLGVNSFEVYYESFRSKPFNITIKPPICTDSFWSCGEWSDCLVNGTKNRICKKNEYANGLYCEGGISSPEISRNCTPICTLDKWSCDNWGTCSNDGQQNRNCKKIYDCPIANTLSPETDRPCTPPCSLDNWSCSEWGPCSSSGTQSRSCAKTLNCDNTERRVSPAITQYCKPPSTPKSQTPLNDNNKILNQNSTSGNSTSTINQNLLNTKELKTNQTQDKPKKEVEDSQTTDDRGNEADSAVQEILKITEEGSEIEQQIETITQLQVQNQKKLENSLKKVQHRNGLAKFFIGPNYSEISNAKKLLEQNREQIKQLDQIKNQLANQDNQRKLNEQTQLLEQANQEIENSFNISQKGFSLFGWLFKMLAR